MEEKLERAESFESKSELGSRSGEDFSSISSGRRTVSWCPIARLISGDCLTKQCRPHVELRSYSCVRFYEIREQSIDIASRSAAGSTFRTQPRRTVRSCAPSPRRSSPSSRPLPQIATIPNPPPGKPSRLSATKTTKRTSASRRVSPPDSPSRCPPLLVDYPSPPLRARPRIHPIRRRRWEA